MAESAILFREWLCRVRAGDERAAEELVRRYGPAIRVVVRARLTDPKLLRRFDASDVCQSVWASFFIRMAIGQFELDTPAQLVALLKKMAWNKVLMHTRNLHRARRDVAREAAGDGRVDVAVDEPGPATLVLTRDLIEAVLRRFDGEERAVAQLRAAGRSWEQIAAELGGTAEGRRKQLARAVQRLGADG